eukprot:TRINITY_DN768_c1_g1_i1.p1 TRINITY_DN768_c1_g1~~TRINITY_DN768_c1_g1_i1.p1  ORF type:complete len:361 (+),score=177.92 TRINITY_DN768_c1_g1_i1:88-1083(+)
MSNTNSNSTSNLTQFLAQGHCQNIPRKTFRDYDMSRQMTSGRYAQIWAAKDASTGEDVVIKVSNFEDNTRNEFDCLSRLVNVPHVMQLKGCCVNGSSNTLGFVLEKAETDLMELVERRGPLDEKTALKYFRDICHGLSHCHDRKIAHLDLKPENILVSSDDRAIIADFELSYNWAPSNNPVTDLRVGTVYYAAPEVNGCRESYVAKKADIWSLGVLLYVLISGTWPFRGATYQQIEANARAANLYFSRTDYSPELNNLLRKLLCVDPNGRPSIEQILLHPWVQGRKLEDPLPIHSSASRHLFRLPLSSIRPTCCFNPLPHDLGLLSPQSPA